VKLRARPPQFTGFSTTANDGQLHARQIGKLADSKGPWSNVRELSLTMSITTCGRPYLQSTGYCRCPYFLLSRRTVGTSKGDHQPNFARKDNKSVGGNSTDWRRLKIALY